jgi:ribulose-5-phosphate 4-epimerase/fuculose-1-phosphate aldolase
MISTERDHALLIACAVRILNASGAMGKSGHVSRRDPTDPGVMWINSQGASRSTIGPQDVVPIDLRTGARIGDGPAPPTELHIHRSIYLHRPEVAAVVHSHPPYVVALSVAGQTLRPVMIDGGFLPEEAPFFDSAAHVDTAERGELLATTLGDSTVVVMRGHGMALVAASVEEATCRLLAAEDNARIQYLASALAEPRALERDELERVAKHTGSGASRSKAWRYELETARRSGALDGLDLSALG